MRRGRRPPEPSTVVLFVSQLCEILEGYLEPEQVREVYRAYLFSAEAHEGQRRRSGEPYIFHPLAVAGILAQMRFDYQSVMAALLHDVIEDTPITKEQLAAAFGEEVAELVDGVSKLTHIHFDSKAEAQAENFRKMMLAMVRDIRVILVKLADRLHNMRTLGVMPPPKQRRIARETLDIYAPIAARLGLNTLRLELEELCFQAYWPLRYRVLQAQVKRICGNRKEVVQRLTASISERLQQEGLTAEVQGRTKHLYSIYQKMRNKRQPFREVMDLFGVRIVVESVDHCYRTLGMIHNLYKPIPGRFKDYIAIPKANGYQSLHTALISHYGIPIEAQIRTAEMDRIAEVGIAAHWQYKHAGDESSLNHTGTRQWLRDLLEMQKRAGDSLEFLEHVKVDLFPDEIYVFTPDGDIMQLPRGATAVDFAYAVHSDVGNACVAVKVNQRLVPLRNRLLNGQTVQVITAPGAHPNANWLNFVVTGKARANIRSFLKQLKRDEAIELGERMLAQALSAHGLRLENLLAQQLPALLTAYRLDSSDTLLAEIGIGNRMATLVATALAQPQMSDPISEGNQPLRIKGTEGTVVHFGRCCHPIPGDAVIGFMSAGRGLVIHTQQCRNIAEFRRNPDKWIDVEWAEGVSGDFPVELRVEVRNQRGVLATVAAAIAASDANIENISLTERDGNHTTILITVLVHNRHHLAAIMRRLRSLDRVLRITRPRA